MSNAGASRTLGATVVGFLVLVQSVAGVLRALQWFEIGSDLLGRGLLIIPLIGVVAYVRGALVAGIALLYIVFALGIFTRKGWARSVGITVALVNLLLVVSVVVQGESLFAAIGWAIIPVIILWYLIALAAGEAGSAN